MARRRKEQAAQDTMEVVEADLVTFAVETPVEAEVVLPDSVEAQEGAPVAAPVPTKWKVLEDKTVSLFGQVTLLPAGTVVSAASYGPIGLRRIMEQGVALEPVA